jgi:hypothetical protein
VASPVETLNTDRDAGSPIGMECAWLKSGLVWNTCSLESIVRLRGWTPSAENEGLSGVNGNMFWDHGKGREGLSIEAIIN